MKDIIKVCKFIAYDKEAIRKKPTQKHKHGNQFTVRRYQNTKNMWKHQKFIFSFVIPHKSTDFIKVRIQADIMFASGEYQSNSLGKLSVHPISNQYRVIRIDKRKKLLSTSLELYELPVIPLEQLARIIFTRNPLFANVLQSSGTILMSQFEGESLCTQADIDNLTSITQPFDCIVSKLVNQEIITTQRICNFAFLEMMGITERMYRTYVHETGQQPSPVFYDQSDNYFQKFGAWFSTWPDSKQHLIELINYRGEKFKAYCTFKTLFVRCNVQNIIYRCCFWIYQVDNRSINVRNSKINELDYFNGKQIKIYEEPSHSIQQCGFKEILNQED